MLAAERRNKIAEFVNAEKSITVAQLAEMFGVSEPTIRRDLQALAEQGLIQRAHGGALGVSRAHYEPTFTEKELLEQNAKQEIAALAAALVQDGETVILDSGTTTLYIARALKGKNVTVVTNSPLIALELAGEKDMEILLVGGMMRPTTKALVGPLAEGCLRDLRVDKAFLGANGITLNGITTPNLLEAATKRAMLRCAAECYVAADYSKFGVTTFAKFAALDEISALITDSAISAEWLKNLTEAGAELIYPVKG